MLKVLYTVCSEKLSFQEVCHEMMCYQIVQLWEPNCYTYRCRRSVYETSLTCTDYIHNRCTKTLPTCVRTPWVPSSGSIHSS